MRFIVSTMKNSSIPKIDSHSHFGPSYQLDEITRPWTKFADEGKVLIPQWGPHVSCGLFGISDDFIEKYQSLDAKLIKNREATFFFKAAGNSMVPTLFPGEILVVDRSITHFDRRVCIVVWEGELICKRVFLKENHVILRSDNRKYQDIIVNDPDCASIWGVVIARAGEVH